MKKKLVGFNPHGIIMSWDIKDFKTWPISYKADTLMDALFEMFDLSRGDIRRLVKGNALRGYFAEKVTEQEIIDEKIKPSDRYDFICIQLGKYNLGGSAIPRWGFIILNKDLRNAFTLHDEIF